jgi:hypothetical protein
MMNSFLTASLDEVIDTLTPRAEARRRRVDVHGESERKKLSDWKITVIYLAINYAILCCSLRKVGIFINYISLQLVKSGATLTKHYYQ